VSKNICSEGEKHSTEYSDVSHKNMLLILMYILLSLNAFVCQLEDSCTQVLIFEESVKRLNMIRYTRNLSEASRVG
jgi:hypothetical protein